jgi:CubicO group peptidase (beta-lactamase class C family)
MFQTRRQFCLQGLALGQAALSVPVVGQAALPVLSAVKSADIDRVIADALRIWAVPGIAAAVVRDDKIEYLAGHGVKQLDRRPPVTPDTLFPMGSCTKGFTTTALAMLVDEGKLGWDDPVRKHVPFFRLSDSLADRAVSLRDLLCHRTGLGTHDLLWYRAAWPPEEAVRRVGLLPLSHPFRTTFQYQSTMFTAAGLALASAAKSSWADFIEKRLFAPLGMKTAGCSTAALKSEDRATGHRLHLRGTTEPSAEWLPQEHPDAASTIHVSARDLCPWLRLHLREGTFDSKRLVSAENLGETHTPQMVIPLHGRDRALYPESVQMSYGMGWVIQDYRGWKTIAHSGILDGFRVQLTLVPKARLGFALLANLHATRMNLALGYSLLDLFLGLEKRDWNRLLLAEIRKDEAAMERAYRERLARRHHDTKPSRRPANYAGVYTHPVYGEVHISLERERGRLLFRWGAFRGPLEHFHYDTFVVRLGSLGQAQLTFALDALGEVSEMSASDPFGAVFHRKR